MRVASRPASRSGTSATSDHSSSELRWFGCRRLPTARPGKPERATSTPSAQAGANTCTSAIRLLITPATTQPRQKASSAWRRASGASAAADQASSSAASSRPSAEAARLAGSATEADHSTPAASKASGSSSAAPARVPARTCEVPNSAANTPHNPRAAAWLKKVAEGGRLNATSVGTQQASSAARVSA